MPKPVILLIDDDKTLLNSMMDQLRNAFRNEFAIEAVQTITEARTILDMLDQQKIQVKLVISDWLIPPERTNQLLIDIHHKYPSIALVLLSGYADDEAIAVVKEKANLRTYIRKPWEEEELITTVRALTK